MRGNSLDNFPKSETTMGLEGTLIHRFVGGPNIVFLSGHDWKRHRKVFVLHFIILMRAESLICR